MSKFTHINEEIRLHYSHNSLSEQLYMNVCNEIDEYWSKSNYIGIENEFICELDSIKLEEIKDDL